MNEPLDPIVAERQAIAAKYARFAYVAPHHRIERKPPVAEAVVAVKEPIPLKRKPAPYTWQQRRAGDIVDAVAEAYKVTAFAIVSKTSTRRVAHPRFAAALLMRERRGMSLPQIARYLGWRDHTTAHHAVARARDMLVGDPEWAALYRAAEHALAQS